MTPSPFDDLTGEHVALRAEVQALRDALRSTFADPDGPLAFIAGPLRLRAAAFHKDFRMHCRREEECLYPEARQLVAAGSAPDDRLQRFLEGEAEEDLSAHTGIANRVAESLAGAEAVAGSGQLAESELLRLRSMLTSACVAFERHTDKEDSLIYPVLQRNLTRGQLQLVQERLWMMPWERASRDAKPAPEEDEIPGW